MKKIYLILAFVAIFIICDTANKKIRTYAQARKSLYEIIRANDLCVFALNGGGTFGYSNYYKWFYAKWINDSKRTTFERIMFWKVGIFYDVSNPPEEYEYPFKN